MGFFDQASKKFAAVQKKTGDTIAVYKLQSQIKNAEEDVQRIYAAIGEICYAAHKTGKAPEDLEEEELRHIVTFACTAAGLSTTKAGGISSVPEKDEVLARVAQ